MAVAYINIGSNLGNRKAFIELALQKISDMFGVCCMSSYIESEPWGFESGNRFLNLGVSFQTSLHPEELLVTLQKIEKEICNESHRNAQGGYIDRKIDIDIMAIDSLKYSTSCLTVPHPHLSERDFFLMPLMELCPQWTFPD
ncbi:MAG: 2-amino-4-hydroxy-6-hydroxymethyldihydropteridine diphosphokinase [Muribaculaceae bacterium]|nr:2-amino-4-hydroxy-6-hydroxymethyldihydropteridine diphosphokinase [Muribaculaceae bacterium]